MRYARYRHDPGEEKRSIHPVWRGIGCIFALLAPILSVAIANEIVLSGFIQRYVQFPRNWLRPYTIPGLNYTIEAFLGTMVISVAVLFLLFTIYFTTYAALYKVSAPSPYGPTDVPPIHSKRKVRKSR